MNKSNDEPGRYLSRRQNFSGMPGDRHSLDENASKTEPAKLLTRVRGRYGREGTVNAARKMRRFAGKAAEQITGIISVGRVGTAEHVAAAVLYLCSENAKFTVGTSLVVDGGFIAG